MNFEVVYNVFDKNDKYVGFTYSEEEAIEMASETGGRFEWEFLNSNSIFG